MTERYPMTAEEVYNLPLWSVIEVETREVFRSNVLLVRVNKDCWMPIGLVGWQPTSDDVAAESVNVEVLR